MPDWPGESPTVHRCPLSLFTNSSPVRPTITNRFPTRGNAFSGKKLAPIPCPVRAQSLSSTWQLRLVQRIPGTLSHVLGVFENWEQAGFGVDGLGGSGKVQLFSVAAVAPRLGALAVGAGADGVGRVRRGGGRLQE